MKKNNTITKIFDFSLSTLLILLIAISLTACTQKTTQTSTETSTQSVDELINQVDKETKERAANPAASEENTETNTAVENTQNADSATTTTLDNYLKFENWQYSKINKRYIFDVVNSGNDKIVLQKLTSGAIDVNLENSINDFAKNRVILNPKQRTAIKGEIDLECVKNPASSVGAKHIVQTLTFNLELDGKIEKHYENVDLACT